MLQVALNILASKVKKKRINDTGRNIIENVIELFSLQKT